MYIQSVSKIFGQILGVTNNKTRKSLYQCMTLNICFQGITQEHVGRTPLDFNLWEFLKT